MKVVVKSSEEMVELGREKARSFTGKVLALKGELGSGKTTFLKGFISTVAGVDERAVQSPTFTYLQVYEGVCHFDLYRLKNWEQFESAGFVEYLEGEEVCCLEWAERIEGRWPRGTVVLEFSYVGEGVREVYEVPVSEE